MFLEMRVLEVLNKGEATAGEISEKIDVATEKVEDVLNRLSAAGLLIEG